MLTTTASHTAQQVAMQRAAHQVLDAPVVFTDPIAVGIAGEGVAAQLGVAARLYRTPFALALRSATVARSRHADEVIAGALARGTRQIVIVAAGLDTFAYRTSVPAGTRIVETDHPATLALKRERLAAIGIELPEAVTFAAADLEHITLADALGHIGLDQDQPIAVVALGLTYYLPPMRVRSLLTDVAGWGSDSELVFDYFVPAHYYAPDQRPGFDEFGEEAATRGEPWLSSFEPDEMARSLTTAGFRWFEDLDSAAMTDRYFARRTDGLRPMGPIHFVHATV